MNMKISDTAPLSDEERARKWKIIQGLAAQVLEDNDGKDIKIICKSQ